MNWNILIIKEKKKNVSSGERKQKPNLKLKDLSF